VGPSAVLDAVVKRKNPRLVSASNFPAGQEEVNIDLMIAVRRVKLMFALRRLLMKRG
jgi:hypothetical protein